MINYRLMAAAFFFYGIFSGLAGQDIHQAAKAGDLEEVARLIGEDPLLLNLKSSGGSSPLHFAATHEDPAVAEYLLSIGAPVNEYNASGYTPLHYAAVYNREAVASVLILHGGDPETCSLEGHSSLHMAAISSLKRMMNSWSRTM